MSFDEAIKAFRDPFAVERIDDREEYDEERIRIISARQADRHEQDHYYRENSA